MQNTYESTERFDVAIALRALHLQCSETAKREANIFGASGRGCVSWQSQQFHSVFIQTTVDERTHSMLSTRTHLREYLDNSMPDRELPALIWDMTRLR